MTARVIVAGGGGAMGNIWGSGPVSGGAAGGSTGGTGGGPNGGGGGSQSVGGSPDGALGVGGSSGGGGGGGGGHYGGGSGFAESFLTYSAGGGGSSFVSGTNTSTASGVRSGNGQIILSWSEPQPQALSYSHSLGGRMSAQTELGTTRSFTYDGAGRLTQTVQGSTTRSYAYDANTNRCALASTCSSPTFTYDNADRLLTSPYASAYAYDAHGNITSSTPTAGNPSVTIGYDTYDHATTVNDGTNTVTETLSPSGRVLRRIVTVNATSAVTEDVIFGYAGGGDSPAYSRPYAGGSVTTYLGGMIDVAGTAKWTLGNAHGDLIGTLDAAATFTTALATDEFGVGGTTTDRLGWLGTHHRPSIGGATGLIRMGVRLYDPALGRFLQTDPIEGGSCNDYDYVCGDPVNLFDLSGEAIGSMPSRAAAAATRIYMEAYKRHQEEERWRRAEAEHRYRNAARTAAIQSYMSAHFALRERPSRTPVTPVQEYMRYGGGEYNGNGLRDDLVAGARFIGDVARSARDAAGANAWPMIRAGACYISQGRVC